MKVYSLLNNKGGVSKSVSAASISSLLSKNNKRILLIDLDPQGSLTSLYREAPRKPLRDLLIKESVEEDEFISYIIQTYDDNVSIIPGDESLTRAIYDLYEQSKTKEYDPNEKIYNIDGDDSGDKVNYRLRNFLKLVRNNYDYVIIDNSPFYTYLSKLALYASDFVLAPIDLDNLSYEGLLSLVKRIKKINRYSIYDVKLKVFLTKVNSRTNLFKALQEQYKDVLGDIFCNTYIRHDNSVKEASTEYFPIPDYAPRTSATMDYLSLIEEVMCINRKGIKRIESNLVKIRR